MNQYYSELQESRQKNETIFNVVMLAKPRMVRSDRWRKRPTVLKYWKLKDELLWIAKCKDFVLPEVYTAEIIIPIPKSWSKKKKLEMDGRPHRQRPDIDNILKSINDIFLGDDSSVWDCRGIKKWGQHGKLIIINREI